MLKEKLYSEYQRRYREYMEKHKLVEEFETSVEQLQSEGRNKKAEIEEQKKSVLQDISNKKKDLEVRLASVKKDGTNSSALKEYSNLRLREIQDVESDLQSLKQSKTNDLKDLQKKKKKSISGLEAEKELCQKRLNDLMNGGDGSSFVKNFDEDQLRQQLDKDKERKIAKLTSQYDSSIATTTNALEGIDGEYNSVLNREISYVEKNSQLCDVYYGLNNKLVKGELPQVITAACEEPIDSVIRRKDINGGQKVAEIAGGAVSLDDLSKYNPEWLIGLVETGFPIILGGLLFLIFILTGVHFGFVATATNAIISFLLRALCEVIAFVIFYFIAEIILEFGTIGGIIGLIIGFFISATWEVTLPPGVTNVIEWIIKVIICIVVIAVAHYLNNYTGLGDVLINVGMKFDFVKKAALEQQGYTIQENVDSYYVLLKYKEIIGLIVEQNKRERVASLNAELAELQSDKANEVEKLETKIDQETEHKVASEKAAADASRKQYEQTQMDLIQMQDECMIKLSGYDGRIQDESDKYDEMIRKSTSSYEQKITDMKEKLQQLKAGLDSDKDSLLTQLEKDIIVCDSDYSEETAEYDKKIAECEQDYERRITGKKNEIASLQEQFKPKFDAINELFMKIYRGGSPELEETKGVVSDTLYIFNGDELSALQNKIDECKGETGSLSPVIIHEIRHEKNPIVFLYDSKDSSKIATDLFKFMDAINIGLYTINCKKIYDLYITDPVSKGINFKDQEQAKRLSIVDDIKELYEVISESMDFVASKGQKLSIDELNVDLVAKGNDEEDINKFGKYKVVQFIVPEEESTQTTDFFNNDIWTKFETSKKHGFLPIFYIKKSEWESALDDEAKFNSKFIMKLNKALGSSQNNIFVIDTQNISISKYHN